MANLVRNDITIEGDDLQQVLDAIGFKTQFDTRLPSLGEFTVLFNFDRVVARPENDPAEGWSEWFSNNWGTCPYDCARPKDILEQSDNKICFIVYTKWTPIYDSMSKVVERFPNYKYDLYMWEQSNDIVGEVSWVNGRLRLVIQPYTLERRNDCDCPAFCPVGDAARTRAKELVQVAAQLYKGSALLRIEDAERIVAEALAGSGRTALLVQFVTNDDGSCCLCVDSGLRLANEVEE